jgi:ribosomal protein S18 acetylase RimI-like enzyme
MIHRAKISEIHEILAITKACAKHMAENGIFQWNDDYPSKLAFENDISRKELYTYKIDMKIVGSIVISTKMDDEYLPVTWLTPNKNNIYIHRLAILPSFQGKGFARNLMDYAETYAQQNSYASIRLDTFSKNKRNQKFYETRGYQRLGDIYFPKQSGHPFHCYELVF